MRHHPMYMSDYVKHLDNVLSSTGEKILCDAGSISHEMAVDKAKKEYQKYVVQNPSPVEEEYLRVIKEIGTEAKKKSK